MRTLPLNRRCSPTRFSHRGGSKRINNLYGLAEKLIGKQDASTLAKSRNSKRKISKRWKPRSTSRIRINADSSLVKSSTKDKIKGRIDEAKGKVKEKTGDVTGDSDLRDRGTGEKAVGKIQRKIGDVKKVFGK